MPHTPLSDVTARAGNQTVTASELVRQFGIWQDRATRAPVYILNRGRPRLMLATVDLMNALCSPQGASGGPDMLGLLLGAIDEIILLIGPDDAITAASAGARRYFGTAGMPGSHAAQLGDDASHPLMIAAIRRVEQTGLAETIEFPSATRPGRMLNGTMLPLADHILLIVRDYTLVEELRDARALTEAQTAAAASANIAVAAINLRGYLDSPGAALGRLTGLSIETLATARFVSLLDLADRAAAGETIEAVIADAAPRALDAALLVNRGDAVPVRVGLSAIRYGPVVSALCAVIAPSSRLGNDTANRA